jgi:riboflavin kinase/FMN adenylyltransferase
LNLGLVHSEDRLSQELVVQSPGPWLQGVLNYGIRPTFEKNDEKLISEIFILDFDRDLYGQSLEILFHPRLRGEKVFEDASALTRQIQKDVEDARKYFASMTNKSFTKITS